MKRLVLAVLVFTFLLPVPRAQAQENFYRPELQAKDIDATLGLDWYGVYLQNKKIGYCRIERAKAGENIVESFLMNMKLTAFGQKTEMNVSRSLTFEAKAPYRLLAAMQDEREDKTSTKITADRKGEGFHYVISAGGKDRTKTQGDVPFLLSDNFAGEAWVRANPKVGAKIVTRDLDIEDWKTDPTDHKLVAIKTGLVAGVEVKYYEIQSTNHKNKITYLTRFDSTGRMISSNLAIFELRKETEEQAKNTEFAQDLFVLGMAKLDRGIGHTTKLTELVLEVHGKEGDVLKNGPRQTVVTEKGVQQIKLGKKHGHALKVDEKESAENLMETNDYLITDPKVKALAEKVVGDAKTPAEKVKRIVAFVHDFVIPTYTVSMPRIHDLLEKKKGDCKSYALLTTTLCRAAGVPSREAAGLLYMGDDSKAFGGHAWNEVVLDGVWVPVDASLNQIELDAGHISFGEQRIATGAMLQTLGKLSFKVVEARSMP